MTVTWHETLADARAALSDDRILLAYLHAPG